VVAEKLMQGGETIAQYSTRRRRGDRQKGVEGIDLQSRVIFDQLVERHPSSSQLMRRSIDVSTQHQFEHLRGQAWTVAAKAVR
jgi:hypothetical protein